MALNTGSLNTAALNEDDIEIILINEASAIHNAAYRSVHQILHRVSYHSESIHALQEVNWTLIAQALQEASYQSAIKTQASQDHESIYASLGLHAVFTQHKTSYVSLGGSETVCSFHTVTYESAIQVLASQVHQVSYASLGGGSQVLAQHDTSYASIGGLSQIFSLHETSWTVTPNIRQLHITSWKSVIAANQLHAARWASTVDNFALHETRYRSSHSTPILQDGLMYVRV